MAWCTAVGMNIITLQCLDTGKDETFVNGNESVKDLERGAVRIQSHREAERKKER